MGIVMAKQEESKIQAPAEAKRETRPQVISTVDAKKEVLDYLLTILDFVEYNLPEDLREKGGEKREYADIVRILAAIRALRTEFLRRTRPPNKTV